MNVISAAFKEDALFVGVQASLTHITVRNAHKWKKTGMGVQKLLTWVAQKLIYGMNAKSMVSKKGHEKEKYRCIINS